MLLRTAHLTKDYGRFRALDDLNLEIARGEVFGLLGPNGSGKTTALRLLMGFMRPSLGHAWIAGHDCWHDSVAARRQVAYLPGELRLYENMTGRQLVRFLGQLRGQGPLTPNPSPPRGEGSKSDHSPLGGEGNKSDPSPPSRESRIQDLACRFDIDLDRPLAALSSGMKRKVALLQVLAPHAALLIMDEPTNALDPTMRDELLEQVRQAQARGQAVLFSSHVLNEVEAVCDRVGILRRGRLVHLQPMKELRQGREIKACLAGPMPDLAALPGLRLRERKDDRVSLEYDGAQAELFLWLARQPLVDVRLEPMGLASIYQRYHGGED